MSVAICHANSTEIFLDLWLVSSLCIWMNNISRTVQTVNDMMVKRKIKQYPKMAYRTGEKLNFLSLSYFLLHLLPAERKINANNKYANYCLGHSFKSLSNVEYFFGSVRKSAKTHFSKLLPKGMSVFNTWKINQICTFKWPHFYSSYWAPMQLLTLSHLILSPSSHHAQLIYTSRQYWRLQYWEKIAIVFYALWLNVDQGREKWCGNGRAILFQWLSAISEEIVMRWRKKKCGIMRNNFSDIQKRVQSLNFTIPSTSRFSSLWSILVLSFGSCETNLFEEHYSCIQFENRNQTHTFQSNWYFRIFPESSRVMLKHNRSRFWKLFFRIFSWPHQFF